MRSISALAGLLLASPATALLQHFGGMEVGPPVFSLMMDDTDIVGKNGSNGWGTFDQLIDHSNPAKGTFKMRYWYGSKFWKGPGSPVFVVSPGEQAATNFNTTYTTDQRLAGRWAAEMGGAVIVLEHRYWGESSPYDVLTEENLQQLTLDNSLKDIIYFARNFDAPWDTTGGSAPDKAPWVFSGGSYSGALAGWLAALHPGTFWAYHGTSGVVQAVGDFWTYFSPVQEATPSNCSADVNLVMEHVDRVLKTGSPERKQKLKKLFKLENLEDADFGSALEAGPWKWQSTQFSTVKTSGYNRFHRFCDYVENVWPGSSNKVPGPEGVGLCKAIKGYAKWYTETELPGTCAGYGYDEWKSPNETACLQGLNATNLIYKDLTVDNPVNRQWNWMLCNEAFEWWQTAAPEGQPTLVSRLVNYDYWVAQCPLWFPKKTYGYARGRRAETVNTWTGGWDVTTTTRLMHVNGQLDPWRDATVASVTRPGGPLKSTAQVPTWVIPGGIHCSDLYGPNWGVNEGVAKIVEEITAQMKTWVGEFYESRPHVKNRAIEWVA